MTYNITAFKVKRMEDFRINLNDVKATFAGLFSDFTEDDLAISSQGIIFFGNPEIRGQVIDDWLYPKRMWIEKEWSGTIWRDIIKPTLKTSTGTMEAVLIWEGGDYAEKVSVIDGEITETEIVL